MMGCFLKLEVAPSSKKGRTVKICFPVQKEGMGWKKAAESLDAFIGLQTVWSESARRSEVPGKRTFAEVVREGRQEHGGFTAEAACRGRGVDGEGVSGFSPLVEEPSLAIKIESGVLDFSLTNLSEKFSQLVIWVKACSQLEGRWSSTWSDGCSMVEVILNMPMGFSRSSARNNSRKEEEEDREKD